jgi:alanine racemase
MDMAMADVSHIPDVAIGDEVIIFGSEPTVEELADCLDTIPYEIFTSISPRVKRVYIQE